MRFQREGIAAALKRKRNEVGDYLVDSSAH
jgi:hypothetical protein